MFICVCVHLCTWKCYDLKCFAHLAVDVASKALSQVSLEPDKPAELAGGEAKKKKKKKKKASSSAEPDSGANTKDLPPITNPTGPASDRY